jgi:hypothetical protein
VTGFLFARKAFTNLNFVAARRAEGRLPLQRSALARWQRDFVLKVIYGVRVKMARVPPKPLSAGHLHKLI